MSTPTELQKTRTQILRTATKWANQRARQEILDLLAMPVPNELRRSWNPFKAEFIKGNAYDFKLTPQADKFTTEIMKSERLYEIMERIATESTQQAILHHDKRFVRTLLDDLFSENPTYQVKTV